NAQRDRSHNPWVRGFGSHPPHQTHKSYQPHQSACRSWCRPRPGAGQAVPCPPRPCPAPGSPPALRPPAPHKGGPAPQTRPPRGSAPMPVITQTVVIARPAAEVLDLLARAENLPRWDSSIVECVQMDAAPVTVGEGTRLRYRLAAESGLGGAFGRAMEPLIEK